MGKRIYDDFLHSNSIEDDPGIKVRWYRVFLVIFAVALATFFVLVINYLVSHAKPF